VAAQVLVLSDTISVEEGRNLLWRRETRREGSGKQYRESSGPNAVVRWLLGKGKERPPDSALEILRQRYARGEINKEEFETRKKDLGG
jgi:hypothetical protein